MKQYGFVLTIVFIAIIIFYIAFLKPQVYETTDMYDDIMKRGYIRVGINTDSKPFGFLNEKGEYCGYDAELARYIAQYILNSRQKVYFVSVTPADRLIKLTTGEVDIVIATMTITPQREKIINFSIPYDAAGMAILTKTSSKISTIGDLTGQNIGIIWGTTAEKNIANFVPGANIIGFRSYKDAYYALKQGKVNAITSDDTLLSRFAVEDSEVKLLPKRYTKEPYGVGIRQGKGSAKLKNALDFAINDMRQKGIILHLHKQWLKNY